MRCCSCNANLTDSECTRRVLSTGDFLDMCSKCYKPIEEDVPTFNRIDDDETEETFDNDDFVEEKDVDLYDDGAAEYIRGLPYQDE